MFGEPKASTSVQRIRMYRMAGSGSVVSSVWQAGEETNDWHYHFNLFQMPSETGRASHLFGPEDLISLLKVCREVATILADAPSIAPLMKHELAGLAARLDVVFRTEM